ncbi:MAG: hypothetical protein R2991_14430 [Thermoanaerobaculia bacterium]
MGRTLFLTLGLLATPASAPQRLLLVPWELLHERSSVEGELRLEVTVEVDAGGRTVVGGEAGWRTVGAPSWVPLEPGRVRRRRGGAVATFTVLCDPAAGLEPGRDTGPECGELIVHLPGMDAARASTVLGEVTLGADGDPIEDLAPWAAEVLQGRLGRGALGLSPRLQATLLWMLRPERGWPRIALDPQAAEPTLRVDLKLRHAAGFPFPCWAQRTVDARALDLAGELDDAARAEGYALTLDLHLLVPPESLDEEPDEPGPSAGGFDVSGMLAGPAEALGGLWEGAGVWDELRVRLGAAELAAWADGRLSTAELEAASTVRWNGERLALPAPAACR